MQNIKVSNAITLQQYNYSNRFYVLNKYTSFPLRDANQSLRVVLAMTGQL